MGMRRELVDFIDVYGHDFLNYLQVISGLAQLGNPEGIREYVQEVTGRVREVTQLAKLENTTVAALLLVFRRRAARYGVPFRVLVERPPAADAVPAAGLEAVLEPALGRLAALVLPALEGAGETVELTLTGEGKEDVLVWEFPVRLGELIDRLEETAAGLDRALGKIGGGGGFTVRDGEARLVIRLPRREA